MTSKVRKIISILVVFILITAIIQFVSRKPIIVNANQSISERSKKFLADKYPDFRYETEINNTGQIFETECFSLTLPFSSFNYKTETIEGTCTFFSRISQPPSQLVIIVKPYMDPIEEESSFKMRKMYSDKYNSETIRSYSDQDIYKFSDIDSVTYYYIKENKLITISFSSLADTSFVNDEDIKWILSTIAIIVQ